MTPAASPPGVYGGFAQGGVGFVLIAALAGTLRYDLLRTNALKMLCTGTFTLVSLAILNCSRSLSAFL
mgnify:CR=1 FL=1